MAKRRFDAVHPGMVLAEDFLKGLETSQYRLAKGDSCASGTGSRIAQRRC